MAWIAVAIVVRVGFVVYTERVWEDALITVAHARNAVEGLGLTHHIGEPITQGFTSALSVLIPLLGESIDAGSGIFAIRMASLGAAAVTILMADRVAAELGLSRWARFALMGYLALDPNQIFYGMSGMETQVAVLLLFLSIWTVLRESSWVGVCLGLSLLARPDFALWAIALFLGWARLERKRLRAVVPGVLAVVLPWLAFTTWYYGSPIPQPIIAKAAVHSLGPPPVQLADVPWWLADGILRRVPAFVRTTTPFLEDSLAYAAPVPIPILLSFGATVIVAAAAGMVAHARSTRWKPIVLLATAYMAYRLLFLPTTYFDWYGPPFTGVLVLLALSAIDRWKPHSPFRAAAPVAVAIVLAYALPLLWVFPMERLIQRDIEDAVRERTSVALGDLVEPGSGVTTEPAGYIGYISRATLYDYPGLTSKTALSAILRLPPPDRTLSALIATLEPPWLVLRPPELDELRASYPSVASRYSVVRSFGEWKPSIEVGGYRKHTADSAFLILRRS
jgi:hypothetical protein